MIEPGSRLRAIRFVMYIITILYAALNVVSPQTNINIGLSSALVATSVGITQLLAALTGLVLDLRSKDGVVLKAVLMLLTLGYVYEFVIISTTEPSPYRWAPFLAYAVICAVLYISEE